MLMHRETNNIIKIFYDISKRLADKTVQCMITATNKYDFLEKGGQNNLQWHKNTNQERRQDLRTAAICFLWTAFGLLKHIHLKICCQKTYKTLYRKNCFCLVITHNLSLCRQSETAVGENSPVMLRSSETTHQSQRDNDWSSWLPYRTSVKQSFVSAAFLCIVLFALR